MRLLGGDSTRSNRINSHPENCECKDHIEQHDQPVQDWPCPSLYAKATIQDYAVPEAEINEEEANYGRGEEKDPWCIWTELHPPDSRIWPHGC